MPLRACAVVLLLSLLFVATACGDGDDDDATEAAPDETIAPTLDGSITVSAAASLTDVFDQLGAQFLEQHPEAEVTFNFGSSGALATQILEGAPADVYASAGTEDMARLVDVDLVERAALPFATNELVVVVPPGNPAAIEDLADLPAAEVVSLCVETAPCGRYAAEVLDRADVDLPESDVTRGQDVRATLAAVSEGDAEAAIVYRTDAVAAGDAVETIEVPEVADVVATYEIAAVADSDELELAEAFATFVAGPEGRDVLREAGFGAP